MSQRVLTTLSKPSGDTTPGPLFGLLCPVSRGAIPLAVMGSIRRRANRLTPPGGRSGSWATGPGASAAAKAT